MPNTKPEPYIFQPATPEEGDWQGLTRWLSEEFRRIESYTNGIEDELFSNFVFSAYGGGVSRTSQAISDLGAGWATVPLTQEVITPPRGVKFSAANDSITLDFSGAWLLNARTVLTHNELNQGRTIFARLYNLTQGAPAVESIQFATGRNADGTTMVITGLLSVPTDGVGDEYVMQIGGGDTYSTVSVVSAELSATHVGLVPIGDVDNQRIVALGA